MKKFNLLYVIVIFSLSLIVQNVLIFRSVRGISGDARVVNYSGLVRGATQRLVKMELSYHPNDTLMATLEEYLYGLAGYENTHNIAYMEYEPFQQSISDLLVIWDELKTSIYNYRSGLTSSEALFEVSERHFQKANEATYNAEDGSEGKVFNAELLIRAGIAVISVIVIIVAIAMYLMRRSDQRQMEILQGKNRQLETAILEATEANRAKSVFLSHMSHDIRTPLNGIIGMTTIASGNVTKPEKVQDCLRKIEKSSRHLQSLVNDVLDMSKIESGKFYLNAAEIFLPEFTRDLINVLGQQIKNKHQNLHVSALSVAHENVLGDKLRLNQLFINILSNSVKFTPMGGSIGLTIKEIPCDRDGFACFEFTCWDTGIGMSQEFLQRIFESFSRERDSRIDKIEGSGLGLSITKRIVDMMQGEIKVESEKDKGSKFIVTLDFPIVKTVSVPTEPLKGIRVLIIDADNAVCADAEKELQDIGISAAAKNNAEDALALIEKGEKLDLVIIDWDMPNMIGYDLCKKIRRELSDNIPIIISSVYEWGDIEQEAEDAGVTGFIQKPLYKSLLFSKILETLFSETYKPDTLALRAGLRLDGVRVLMAEDNELNTEIAVEILSASGLVIDCASNGKEVLEIFEKSEPSTYAMILMDMQMPVMTGCEATMAIRKLTRPDAASIPIIAMTANAFEEDIREALDAGMNAHVSKPINFETLKIVMSKFIPVTEIKSEETIRVESVPHKPDSLLEAIAPYGINVPAGLSRFAGNKKIYEKLLLKFPEDTSFEKLSQAIQLEDFDTALKAAHALKGVSSNLSIDTFAEMVFQLEQALKQKNNNQALDLFQQAKDVYQGLIEVLGKFNTSVKTE